MIVMTPALATPLLDEIVQILMAWMPRDAHNPIAEDPAAHCSLTRPTPFTTT